LVHADVLKGKKIATNIDDFWVEKAGASKSPAPVEQDGQIITATIRDVSQQFAEAIALALIPGAK
jgi:hypothetical protein